MPQNESDAPLMPSGTGFAGLDIAQEEDAVADRQATSSQETPTDDATAAPPVKSVAEPRRRLPRAA